MILFQEVFQLNRTMVLSNKVMRKTKKRLVFIQLSPHKELTQSCFFRATDRARAALMDRNYDEFQLINEELHNLSTAAYFTKACKYTRLRTLHYPQLSTSPKPVSIRF